MTGLDETPFLRIERRGHLGVVILDRQDALNALDRAMVRVLSRTLAAWREDPEIAGVLVRPAPGRAFCAGGDVREIVSVREREGPEAALGFFRDEYRLDWRVKRFPKPYIAFMDGITMGGGVGISIHGGVRIATENTVFAMPEAAIGFFPDVGGTFFLPRLPDRFGWYLGLTGERANGADCLMLGVATHYMPAARIAVLEEELAAAPRERFQQVLGEVLADLADDPGDAPLAAVRPQVLDGFSTDDLFEIVRRLEAEKDAFGARTLEVLRQRSPFSLRVIARQLARGAELDFERCLQLEYRMVRRFLEGREFAEGVRAMVVEKDRRPRWTWKSIEEVPGEEVERVFQPVPGGDLGFDWNDV